MSSEEKGLRCHCPICGRFLVRSDCSLGDVYVEVFCKTCKQWVKVFI